MPALLLSLFIAIPIAEIAVFIQAGERFGLWPTLGLIILTALLGATLLRFQGLRTLHRVQESLSHGEMPIGEVFNGLCLLIAGALLITPGFLTDGFGFALFVPRIRQAIGSILAKVLMSQKSIHIKTKAQGYSSQFNNGNQVIDADYTEARIEPDIQIPEGPDDERNN
tara:strand:- start:516 stop:1019 length:504 start_codon:yes stop_codon:yes gene_type:complete